MPNQKRRAALARSKTNARNGRGVSRAPCNSRTLRQSGRAYTLTKLDRHHEREAKNTSPELQTHEELRMRDFNDELKQRCRRDGSYATRANRERIPVLIANQLQEMDLLSTPWTAGLSGTVRWKVSVPAKSCG